MIRQKRLISVARVGIAHNQWGGQPLTGFQLNRVRFARVQRNLADLFAQQDLPALRADDLGHRISNLLHAALCVMDAKIRLQMADQRVHRRHMHRIATDKERMERQRHLQPRVFHPCLGEPKD